MKDLFERYDMVLREVDSWFTSCTARHAARVACTSGCSGCCRGLFDITLLDALFLKSGFDALSPDTQELVRAKAQIRLDAVSAVSPSFTKPWLLNGIAEAEWDTLMPDEDETPCVLLSDSGECLVYRHRPMTCRLNGLPLIDASGDFIFDEWCTLNFRGIDPLALDDLRHPFYELFAQELLLFQEMTRRLLGRAVNELDTVIPAAVFMNADLLNIVESTSNGERG